MRTFIRIAGALVAAGFLSAAPQAAEKALSIPEYGALPELSPLPQHATACSRVANFLTRAHYRVVSVDEDFALKVADQFISYVDYNRTLFTEDEVREIRKHSDLILSALRSCQLDYPFQIYSNALKKRYVKYRYFIDAATKPIDVSGHDRIETDRREASFISSETGLRGLWDAEIKNEYINQILSGKDDEKARERIRRRYSAALTRLTQTTSEDAFSTFENAFAASIDPHTNYFSPTDSENFNDDLNLSLEGIGAVLSTDDEYTTIVEIMPGSPAERSKKLKAKDRITGVRQEDGSYDDVIGWRLSDVVKKIKGPKGTKVTLDIERGEGANAKSFQVEITRERIRLQDREAKGEVRTAYDGSRIGVISVKSFYTNLHLDIKRELSKLALQKVKAVVIDLRSDGGGLLPEAVDSTGLFIKEGPVVVVRDMAGNEAPQEDRDPAVAYDGPLVVLVNRLSASSSEIMSAALRDYGRAVIVGDTTFGKGTVQQNRPLERIYDLYRDPLGSIHYTIAKFYRVNGGSTQLKGVVPDIAFPSLVDESEYGERTEKNALPWDSIRPVLYTPYLDIDAYLPDLQKRHDKRTGSDPVFRVMREDLARYQKLKAEKYLTVNLEERRALKAEDDAWRLKDANVRLQAMGKEPLKKIDDLPEDFEFADVLLNESVNIAADFARAQHAQIHEAPKPTVFSQFAPPSSSAAAGAEGAVK